MQDSIFTQIIKGEIPSYKIYEDAKTYAFLDIEPFFSGHTLVVPKNQVDQMDELPPEDYAALWETVRKLSKHLRTTLGTKRTIHLVMGFDVPHTHVHLLPADSTDQFFQATAQHVSGHPYPYQPSKDELQQMAERLRMEDNA
jgi:histidine triad (HIT) family protein